MINATKTGNVKFWSNLRQSTKTFSTGSGVKESGQQTRNSGFITKVNNSAVDTLVIITIFSTEKVDNSDANRLQSMAGNQFVLQALPLFLGSKATTSRTRKLHCFLLQT